MKKIFIGVLTLLAALTFALPVAAQSRYTWHDDQLLGTVPGDSGSPRVALSGNTAVAVWRQVVGSTPRIHTSRSANWGQTWTAPMIIDAADRAVADPQVALDGNRAVVVFRQSDGSRERIYAANSADGGISWSVAQTIDSISGDALEPQVSISGDNAVVVWTQNTMNSHRIYANRSADGGLTWQVAQHLDQINQTAEQPHVAMSGGNVVAVWRQSDGDFNRIYRTSSTNSGSSWVTPPEWVEEINLNTDTPRVAVSGNRVAVTWIVHDGVFARRVYVNHGAFSGGVLSLQPEHARRLDLSSPGIAHTPRVALDGTNVAVVWEARNMNDVLGTARVYRAVSTDAGLNWSSDTLLQVNTTQQAQQPRVAISGDRIMTVWIEDKDGVNRLFGRYSLNAGSTWSDPVLLEDNATQDVGEADLAFFGNTAVALWSQREAGAYRIFSNNATYDGGGVVPPDTGGGGCFIATAAFGSPLARQVGILRALRDGYLLTNEPGRAFVAWYYQNGPAAARFLEDKPLLKSVVRVSLYPLIGLSFLLTYGYLPLALTGVLLIAPVCIRLRRKKIPIQ